MKLFECGIRAKPSGSIGRHYLYVTTRLYAKDAESAREQAFTEFCERRNLETYPPMQVQQLNKRTGVTINETAI